MLKLEQLIHCKSIFGPETFGIYPWEVFLAKLPLGSYRCGCEANLWRVSPRKVSL